jgi:hypothetical protein
VVLGRGNSRGRRRGCAYPTLLPVRGCCEALRIEMKMYVLVKKGFLVLLLSRLSFATEFWGTMYVRMGCFCI